MKKWKSILAVLLCMLLLSAAACKSGTSNKKPCATATPGASEAPVKGSVLKKYPMLINLDLDGTLKPGMYKGRKIVVATSAGDYEKSMKVYKQLFHELAAGIESHLCLSRTSCLKRHRWLSIPAASLT